MADSNNNDVSNLIEQNTQAALRMMSEITTNSSAIKTFRFTVLAIACLLAGLTVWLTAPEILLPAPIEFPTDARSAALIYSRRDAAVMTAQIGIVRGDLWADAAFAYGDTFWSKDQPNSNINAAPIERTRALTERAITFAPHDSRLWLLLSATYARSESANSKAAAALRMSYYTGPNVLAVIPGRLLLAVQSHELQDEDFQDLVRHDIRVVAIHKSSMTPAIIAAYENAPPPGKQFIERTLAKYDPSMLASVRSK